MNSPPGAPWMHRWPLALVMFFGVVGAALLTACVPWPGPSSGGMAERHATEWTAVLKSQERYRELVLIGTERIFAARMLEVRMQITRALREHEGGLIEDAVYSLSKADSQLSALEADIAKTRPASRRVPKA